MDRPYLFSGIVFATVLVCYHNSLSCGFVFDDSSAIKENKDLRPTSPVANLFWNDFWGTPMHNEKSHKSYRPLCVLTFRWNYALSKLEPMSYHLVNMLLHGIVCVMYFRMCRLFLSEASSFIAAMLFAVHPVHTEAVTGVVGRAELLSSIFYIAAFMTYTKCTGKRKKTVWSSLIATVMLVAIAMLCKEQGITVIGVCCVYEVFVAQRMTSLDIIDILRTLLHGKPYSLGWLRDAVIRAGILVGSTMLLLMARIKVMGAQLPVFTRFDNPASVAPSPARQLTFNYILPVNAWLLLSPSRLCCDWTMGTIPLVESLLDVRNLATVAFYFVLGKFIQFAIFHRGRRARAVIMCLALTVLPFIPASNFFFPVGFVVAERILYTPSMGFCMAVATGFDLLLENKKELKKVLWFGIALLLFTHGAKTYYRNLDWESEYTIFQAALRVNQHNAKLYNNVGHALENDKKYGEALDYFLHAAQVQVDDIGSHINVGRTFNNLKQYSKAEKAYRVAMSLLPPIKPGYSYTARIAPSHLNVFVNLGNLISKNESRLLEADALYKAAISMRADYTQAYINRGDILLRLNRTREAQDQYETALKYEVDNPDIYYNTTCANQMQMGYAAGQGVACCSLHYQLISHLIGSIKSYVEDPTRLSAREWVKAEGIPYSRELKSSAAFLSSPPLITFIVAQVVLGLIEINLAHYSDYRCSGDRPKLGVVLLEQGQTKEALFNFDRALNLDPDHKQTLFNSAVLMQETGHPKLRPEAYKRLNKLLKKDPNDEKVYFNLGMLAMDDHQFTKAERWFKKAIELKDDFRSSLFNLALMLVNDLRQPLDAIVYLQKLLKYYPDHTKGLILMGDININHLKDVSAAEKNFLRILETEPDNVQANHNLCVVYVERGELNRAEKCLQKAMVLAPREKYIAQHLNIVQARIQQANQKAAQHQQQQRQQQQQQPQQQQPQEKSQKKQRKN